MEKVDKFLSVHVEITTEGRKQYITNCNNLNTEEVVYCIFLLEQDLKSDIDKNRQRL